VKIGIAVSKRIDAGKKKGTDKSGIGTKITRIAPSLFIVGSKTSSYQLLETALNAIVIIGMIGQIDDFRMMIDAVMSRSGEECQFMIGWGAGSACMTGLVDVLGIFQGIERSLKKWQMLGCSMNLLFAGMLILIRWNQGKFAISQCRGHSFPNGVQKD